MRANMVIIDFPGVGYDHWVLYERLVEIARRRSDLPGVKPTQFPGMLKQFRRERSKSRVSIRQVRDRFRFCLGDMNDHTLDIMPQLRCESPRDI
ncbi:hypothetical protein EN792_064465 [Mesorhizobium sp. M00.F.Ca.ET.149.01.1.1]|nr:hypothetical protein EN792_064465 [Mesorhizobium sp. M00.F.Ca.ET.149.01.1.1]